MPKKTVYLQNEWKYRRAIEFVKGYRSNRTGEDVGLFIKEDDEKFNPAVFERYKEIAGYVSEKPPGIPYKDGKFGEWTGDPKFKGTGPARPQGRKRSQE